MLLQEGDQDVFKRWLRPKLETISDAEAGVLAEYVVALVVADDTEANIRRNCIESLEDFLQDNTEPLVNQVIVALKDKTYLAGTTAKPPLPQSAPIESIVGSTNFEYEPHRSNVPLSAPKGPAATRFPNEQTAQIHSHGTQQDRSSFSRKRKAVESGADQSREGRDSHYSDNAEVDNRPKQTAGGKGGRRVRGRGAQPQNSFFPFAAMPNLADLPPPPPGPLPFDPANPMAFFAMAAAFGASLPGMPPPPFPNAPGNAPSQSGPKAKCNDYLGRGICTLGTFCPYEHGDAVAVPADKVPAYDPEQSHLAVQPHGGTGTQAAHRDRARNTRGGRPRAPFSHPGPWYDRTNTVIVVEQIPQAVFNEDNVRAYFSQFGAIIEVEMHAYKRLAVIKFEDHSAANRAYRSPKAVFDNRFVKVYWFDKERFIAEQPNQSYGHGDVEMQDGSEQETLDPEEFAKRQAEAQKAFEERRRKAAETDAKAADIERQLKEKEEEIEKIARQLAELSGDNADLSQTLTALLAEADYLFAQHEPGIPAGRGRGEFHGDHRGRGYAPFPPRGRGYGSFRGAYRGRGRGGFFAGSPFPPRRANKKLDNRPRRLAVTGIEADTPRDEALRQHLLNIPDCTSIERHPEQADTLVLTFSERYQAEMFLDESLNIPDIGKLDLAWVPNEAFGGLQSTKTTIDAAAAIDDADDDSSATVGEQEIKLEENTDVTAADADMDVADDVDQWL